MVFGPTITFDRLRAVLCDKYGCTVQCFSEGSVVDIDGTDSPTVYAFTRELGLERKFSTIVVYHDDLPLFPDNVRSFLNRLSLTFDDVGSQM